MASLRVEFHMGCNPLTSFYEVVGGPDTPNISGDSGQHPRGAMRMSDLNRVSGL